ncbi:hypothetical protein TWF679_002787 [Orbilia oligospora]|uniref:Chromo domain-containing protein n=1 Tax=Orbilia oligospora TaxID=2813651 RepID=A0A8H8UST8_ORBOL|nr:hypothetical protein TWF679_002787 [Orbilia oligospora]
MEDLYLVQWKGWNEEYNEWVRRVHMDDWISQFRKDDPDLPEPIPLKDQQPVYMQCVDRVCNTRLLTTILSSALVSSSGIPTELP